MGNFRLKGFALKSLLVLVAAVAVLSSAATYVVASRYLLPGAGSPPAGGMPEEAIRKLHKIHSLIQQKYIEPVEEDKVMEGSYRGMVASLGDPYSVYLNQKDYREMKLQATGTYDGIGVYIASRDGRITVVAPVKGGPAERAGIRAGDRILKVDGADVAGMSVDEVVSRIRGREGEKVTLSVERAGSPAPLEFTITREQVKIIPVEWWMLDGSLGYIRITIFNEHTATALDEALRALRSAKARGVLLDLRQNPGMLLDQCLLATEMFVPAGPIVHVVERSGKKESFNAKGKGLGLPLVVLVDGGSASASEIMAGAIQDRGAGKLVGTRTFGKGLVQTVVDLEDGTAVKITYARYETPNGRTIHGVGLIPDVYVELKQGEIPKAPWEGMDSQVSRAVEVLRSLIKDGA